MGGMRGVDLPLENLRPVAAHAHFRRAHARVRRRRKSRRLEVAHLLRRPHIGPHEAARFARRIRFVLHAIEDEAVVRLRRHLDDVAVHVELPAVIEAAQAAVLVAGKEQRRPPVRAVFVEHADAALAVAKHHEILAQEAHLDRRAVGLGDLLRQAGRDPVAPHDLAHRRIAFDAAQQVVFLGGQHGGASLVRGKFLSRLLS